MAADILEITDDDGTHVRIVCGSFWRKQGPVDGVAADPVYLDVSIAGWSRQARLFSVRGLVRTDRDEYPGAIAAGVRRTRGGHLSEAMSGVF
jgi:hypothetical protein